ncbi:MAG TPA: hypothetical protein VNZ50_00660 [Hyphomicrobiaceae bacterium]|nr:hypothetical protein [Hyphomicrobiaceae bacterium]
MRHAAAGAVALVLISASARGETVTIDQKAWLNYAIIVNTSKEGSDLRLSQHGTINGISSVQANTPGDAQIWTHQRGRRNTAVIHQSGWNTLSGVVQEGPGGFSGNTGQPTTYIGQSTDDGYLSYFATGGLSLITLTDANHTWISRFGRTR